VQVTDPTTVGAGQTVQIVRNFDDLAAQSRDLLWMLVGTGAAGILISILAGLFLAGKALVPIRNSWDRQQQFVSDASHELRTPLAVVKAQAELLLRHPQHTIEDELEPVSSIYQESRRMGNLVESLLTLARADSNQTQLEVRPLVLSALLESLVQDLAPLAESEGIRLETALEANVAIDGDADRLRQLFVILLDNALRYTPTGGTITVTCQKHAGTVIAQVEDTGPGIPGAHLPHIFDRFYRGDKARSREGGGTGLGLAIARWIAEAHLGKITVDSEVGKGSTFRVTLPLHSKGT